MKRIAFTTLAAATALFAAPAMAQDAGTTIVGSDGAPIGTVLSNDGETAIVDTGSFEVPIPVFAFAEIDGAFTMEVTKEQVDGMMAAAVAEQEAAAQAAFAAALVPGAEVTTADAQLLGTVAEIEEERIVLDREGQPVGLPRDLFGVNAEGALVVYANLADVLAAIEASAG